MMTSRILQNQAWNRFREWWDEKHYSGLHVVADSNTIDQCYPVLKEHLPIQPQSISIIPAGESSKSLDLCEYLWQQWMENGLDRQALVVALGGGVVCDLTGFCSATIFRGVECMYVPTSLMAMADAAYGGKTGVNFLHAKNPIGLFRAPALILLEPMFLRTLDDRQLRNGWVEMVKHSLIESPPFFNELEEAGWPLDGEALSDLLKRSVRTKSQFIEQDPFERDCRKALNFGHTLGHAVESYLLESGVDVLHGEAIAYGILAESYLSTHCFGWKPNWLNRIIQLLAAYTSKSIRTSIPHDRILDFVFFDKKKKDGKILFSLLKQPGEPVWDISVTLDQIKQALEFTEQQLNTFGRTP